MKAREDMRECMREEDPKKINYKEGRRKGIQFRQNCTHDLQNLRHIHIVNACVTPRKK